MRRGGRGTQAPPPSLRRPKAEAATPLTSLGRTRPSNQQWEGFDKTKSQKYLQIFLSQTKLEMSVAMSVFLQRYRRFGESGAKHLCKEARRGWKRRRERRRGGGGGVGPPLSFVTARTAQSVGGGGGKATTTEEEEKEREGGIEKERGRVPPPLPLPFPPFLFRRHRLPLETTTKNRGSEEEEEGELFP